MPARRSPNTVINSCRRGKDAECLSVNEQNTQIDDEWQSKWTETESAVKVEADGNTLMLSVNNARLMKMSELFISIWFWLQYDLASMFNVTIASSITLGLH